MTILYQDSKWLVINKPSGISTHRAHERDLGLIEWLRLHHKLQPHICSRLDKGTSGVILFAMEKETVAEAQTIHEEDKSAKSYYFLAGKSSHSSWTETRPIDDKPCKTVFSRVRTGAAFSLYKAVIHRGRTHQIRQHAAAAGIPILGDNQYGGKKFVRLCLHCAELQWPGIDCNLEAPLPDWFTLCLEGVSNEVRCLALAEKRYPFLSEITDCCRLLHRHEYSSDITVDKYGKFLCVSGFNENLPSEQVLNREKNILTMLCKTCDCDGGVVKTNLRDPHRNKLFADIAFWGKKVPESFLVHEHQLHFQIHLNDRQHAGLFLDQRDSRRRIAEKAAGKRVANLFAFTCSFSVHALAADAKLLFSVDLAAGCLRQGQANVAINHLDQKHNAKFIKEDTRKWLARQLRKKENNPAEFIPFDLVVCDPPVFASGGRGMSFHVEKEWPILAKMISGILNKDGIALFAHNHQAANEKFYFNSLRKFFRKVTRHNPPLDFPATSGKPAHVAIYWCEK